MRVYSPWSGTYGDCLASLPAAPGSLVAIIADAGYVFWAPVADIEVLSGWRWLGDIPRRILNFRNRRG